MRFLVVALLACCGGKPPVDPATTPAGPAPCDDMAGHVVGVLQPGGADDTAVQAIHAAVRDRCVGDKWTLDAQRCFRAIVAIGDSDRCATLLTVDQRDAFQHALEAVLK